MSSRKEMRVGMQVVEMKNKNIETGHEHSSKGNQLKWEQDGWWYKADAFGYESLAETVVSELISHSNISEYVVYEPVWMEYKGRVYRGCRSQNFKRPGEEIIPLERLHRSVTGVSLAKQLARIGEVKERIQYTEEVVRNATGIENFGQYLAILLEIDAFFLNEDRHTNNIALLYNIETEEYRTCPVFDMGLSLFSDTREEYPLNLNFEECRKRIHAKPFHRDFDEQLDAVNELYGSFLKFHLKAGELRKVIEKIEKEVRYEGESAEKERKQTDLRMQGYLKQEIRRVEEILHYQASKYQYLF